MSLCCDGGISRLVRQIHGDMVDVEVVVVCQDGDWLAQNQGQPDNHVTVLPVNKLHLHQRQWNLVTKEV